MMTGHRGMGAQVLHELYEEALGVCQICFRYADIRDCNVDHITPVSKGGTDARENLQLSHVWCNTAKGNDRGSIDFNNYWYQKPSKKALEKLQRGLH